MGCRYAFIGLGGGLAIDFDWIFPDSAFCENLFAISFTLVVPTPIAGLDLAACSFWLLGSEADREPTGFKCSFRWIDKLDGVPLPLTRDELGFGFNAGAIVLAILDDELWDAAERMFSRAGSKFVEPA